MENIESMTDIAHTVGESPTDPESAEDLQADLQADQAAEADHTTHAQGDTEAPHHTPLTLLPLQDPMQHQQHRRQFNTTEKMQKQTLNTSSSKTLLISHIQ